MPVRSRRPVQRYEAVSNLAHLCEGRLAPANLTNMRPIILYAAPGPGRERQEDGYTDTEGLLTSPPRGDIKAARPWADRGTGAGSFDRAPDARSRLRCYR